MNLAPMTSDSVREKQEGVIRICCISDTHNFHSLLRIPPSTDILLHAGDFTSTGEHCDVDAFCSWIRGVDVKYKVLIAGNHDMSFDALAYPSLSRRFRHKPVVDTERAKSSLSAGCSIVPPAAGSRYQTVPAQENNVVVYLEDGGVEIEGYKIWGSPWQPEFGGW